MPNVGEIAAFAFGDPKDPKAGKKAQELISKLRAEGWVACEGQSVNRVAGDTGLPHLFEVTGTLWGADGPNSFNIPDLRGQFLRGWNHQKKSTADDPGDPNAPDRRNLKPNGTSGDNVGSAQPSMFGRHDHGLNASVGLGMVDTQEDMAVVAPSSKQHRAGQELHQGGDETRPQNIAVLYCIFTGHVPVPRKVEFFREFTR